MSIITLFPVYIVISGARELKKRELAKAQGRLKVVEAKEEVAELEAETLYNKPGGGKQVGNNH